MVRLVLVLLQRGLIIFFHVEVHQVFYIAHAVIVELHLIGNGIFLCLRSVPRRHNVIVLLADFSMTNAHGRTDFGALSRADAVMDDSK